jgi:hypothetical protein
MTSPTPPIRPRTFVDWQHRLPTRRGLHFAIRTEYSTRFHMFLIVAASVAVAVLVTHFWLVMGVGSIWIRWIWALAMAYATFFAGVWVWLHLSRYGRHLRSRFDPDAPGDLPVPDGSGIGGSPGGVATHDIDPGGGSFDGGGASASYEDANIPLDGGSPLDHVGDAVANIDALDGEGGCLLVIAGVLLALGLGVLFGAAGMVIVEAPTIITEVVFEVLLASTLIRGVRRLQGRDWGRALFRQTWKLFAWLCAATLAFAFFAALVAPRARTTMDVVHTLRGK